MFTGAEIAQTFDRLAVTHVVWLPDSKLGQWEAALDRWPALRLIRVCREGEAWPLAAGLELGGRRPVVIMQITGLFESGDAMRNALFDLRLPLFAIVGARNWLIPDSPDSARKYTRPILEAWGVPYRLIASPADKPVLEAHYRDCRHAGRPGIVLIDEGRG